MRPARSASVLAASLLALVATACQVTSELQRGTPGTAWLAELDVSREVPPTLDLGFGAQRARGPELAAGDRVVFELTFTGTSQVAPRYLAFEVLGPSMQDGRQRFSSFDATMDGKPLTRSNALYRVRIELFGEQGVSLDTSEVELAESPGESHLAVCEAMQALGMALAAEGLPFDADGVRELQNRVPLLEYRYKVLGSVQALVSMLALAQDDDLLSDLLWDVVDKPSALSIIRSLGVDLSLSPLYHEASLELADLPGIELPGPLRSLPLTITLNGEAALFMDLLVVEPAPPWTMTSGIVAFHGQHPTAAIAVTGRLVSASSR